MIRPPGVSAQHVEQAQQRRREAVGAAPARVDRRTLAKQDKLRRIAEAARKLFRKKGFDATTTQEVAERADIGTGTLFLYAKTKEDLLLLAFVDEMLEVLAHAYATVPAHGDLADQALHYFEALFAYHAEDLDLARHVMREIAFMRNPERRADVGRIAAETQARLCELVQAAQARGEIRPEPAAALIATGLFSLYFAPLGGWINGFESEAAYLAGLRDGVRLYVDGLRLPAAAGGLRGRRPGR